jgi:hypothetical protein
MHLYDQRNICNSGKSPADKYRDRVVGALGNDDVRTHIAERPTNYPWDTRVERGSSKERWAGGREGDDAAVDRVCRIIALHDNANVKAFTYCVPLPHRGSGRRLAVAHE